MAKSYSDDLRRRIPYVEKIRGQQRRTGQMERMPHHPGRKPKFTEPLREQLRGWLRQRPDSTLVELQEKLAQEKQLQVSVPALWSVLGKMGLRLKKSHSTRASGIRKPTSSSGKRFSKPWLGARRKS